LEVITLKRFAFFSLPLVLLLILIPGCITIPAQSPDPIPPSGKPSVIQEFSSNPSTIDSGGTSTLLWNVTGATSVSIDQGIGQVAVAGTRVVSPATSTVYTISATNSAGTVVTRSAITTVNSVPLSASPQIIDGVMIITLSAISNESGSLVKSGSQDTGASNYTTKNTACIGDDSSNSESRAFLSFNISAIPPTAVIKEAILDLTGYTKIGNPTYETMYGGTGAMQVYHHQYGTLPDNNTSTSLVWQNRTAKLTENGSFINYPLSPWAWDVKNSEAGTSVIQTLVRTGQTRSQFMIQFYSSTNWDSVADMLCFSNATLTIKYTLP
jgi:hypothetical protein